MSRRPHPVLSSLIAVFLIAGATLCARIAWHSTSLTLWPCSAVLGYGSLLAVGWSLASVWHAVGYRAKRRRDRRPYRPTGRPQPGTGGRPAAPVEGRHNRRTTLLVVAPRAELLTLPLHEVVALPDDRLMAWCGECETRAKKLAKGPTSL